MMGMGDHEQLEAKTVPQTAGTIADYNSEDLYCLHGSKDKDLSSRRAHMRFKVMVDSTRHRFQSLGEDVIEQAHEDACVICCQLSQIEVS